MGAGATPTRSVNVDYHTSPLADPDTRARLADGARRIRDTERRWELTVRSLADLLERVGAAVEASPRLGARR